MPRSCCCSRTDFRCASGGAIRERPRRPLRCALPTGRYLFTNALGVKAFKQRGEPHASWLWALPQDECCRTWARCNDEGLKASPALDRKDWPAIAWPENVLLNLPFEGVGKRSDQPFGIGV